MATENIYSRYARRAREADVTRGSKDSVDWFRKAIRKDRRPSFERVQEGLKSGRIQPGGMFIYEYIPLSKERIPYYDQYPLVLVLEMTKNGWYGLNLHYLAPAVRAKVLAEFWSRSRSGLNIAKAIGRSQYGKQALKRYVATQTRGTPKRVPKADWEIAISLPFEGFQKASAKTAWRG